jgi:hypothetical protein
MLPISCEKTCEKEQDIKGGNLQEKGRKKGIKGN